MTRYGYVLFSELNDPASLVDQAQGAEEHGFDFAPITDHFHPWVREHSDSPFAWTVLGALADRTSSIELGTIVTCPFLRYHPAILAQAVATTARMADGRFVLAVGAGERLNEHVVGAGWPPIDVRHQMLVEAVEAMRLLWEGDFCSYRGRHVTVEDAKIYTLPDSPPEVLVAGSGGRSQRMAAEVGDGFVMDQPDADAVEGFISERRQGGHPAGRIRGLVPLAWDRDEAQARQYAMRFKFGKLGWTVMSELPNPTNFDAATATVREEDMTAMVPTGPDPEAHAQAIRQYVDAGFTEIGVVPIGDDREGFLRFWSEELRPLLP